MKHFDSTHADLYRFDGRFYDLKEENGVLTLQLRRSIIWERSIIGGLAFLILTAAWLTIGWSIGDFYPDIPRSFEGQIFIQMLVMPHIIVALVCVVHITSAQTWTFDKNNQKLHWNKIELSDFKKIRLIKTWHWNNRFHITVQLRNGMSMKIGRFGFCRSENAWRQDAAQIAGFLGVPLEIPEV